MAGTMPMAKAPRTILIRYRAPAILANWRGAVPVMESTNGPSPTMPTAPGRVSVVGILVSFLNAGGAAKGLTSELSLRHRLPCGAGETVRQAAVWPLVHS